MDAKTKQAMFSLKDELDSFNADHKMITVKRSDLEAVVKGLFNSADEWSNQAALGYAIRSAERLGMDTISGLVRVMQSEFDERTLEDAAYYYRKSNY